jgi:cbb3-type cytochrome c oxidase subunit II
MNRLEKFSTIFLIAGFISFLVAFAFLGIWPAMMTAKDAKELEFTEVPHDFKKYYATAEDYKKGVFEGRDIYIKEACWHCHSQYVRPVSGESLYYGNVSTPGEYENALNRPQLFGTRRVGPDLTREAGKRSFDWQIAHLYNPKWVEPHSIMPGYTWYFDESTNPPTPKKEAIALVAYLQQLGEWLKDTKRTHYDMNEITLPPTEESI